MTSSSALRQPLERLYREFDYNARLGRDAIQFPLRYADAADRELVSLLTCCLAYGRVDLFGRELDRVLGVMGPSPTSFVREFDAGRRDNAFDGFLYRFNRPRDLVAFCVAARDVLARHGTLEKCFLAGDPDRRGPIGPALERFARAFLEADLREVFPGGRLSRGYRHLFPLPSAGGPCKRLLLYMRWMVRRAAPDFGLWSGVSPARLLVPVDTHIENMSRAIGLTRRRSRNWRMAEEITARLATVDAEDPVKYDFALCHKRMSGDCLDRRDTVVCAPCGLREVCRHWRGHRTNVAAPNAAAAPAPNAAAPNVAAPNVAAPNVAAPNAAAPNAAAPNAAAPNAAVPNAAAPISLRPPTAKRQKALRSR